MSRRPVLCASIAVVLFAALLGAVALLIAAAADRPEHQPPESAATLVLHPRITDSAHKGDSLKVVRRGDQWGIVRWGWRGCCAPVDLDTAWVSILTERDR
jgi:hypothetical protein